MVKLLVFVAILWAASLAAGCNASKATAVDVPDADCPDDDCADAGCDDDTDGDTDWDCPDPIAETCPNAVEPFPLMFEASEFGEGTRFVDVAPWSVLAERDAGETRTISIIGCAPWGDWSEGPCDATNARIASLDVPVDSGLHAVAVAFGHFDLGTWSPSQMAAVCGDAGCALYGADLNAEPPEAELAPVPGGELPPTAAVHGLWRDQEDILLCAYGDGIHCFDGAAWTSPQSASLEYPLFNDMETAYFDGSPGVVAVGDLGRIAYSGFPYWDGYWGTAYPDWYTVLPHDSFSGGYTVAGEGGVLGLANGDCAIADEDIVALIDLGESGMEWSTFATGGVTRSGRVFLNREIVTGMSGSCYTGQVVGDDPRAVSFSCGIETNIFIAVEGALYGTTDCAVD